MIYECIIIGAGPGGLSAATYLGRAHKKTLLIHRGPLRTGLALHIRNFLGQEDISGNRLIELGIEKAKKYGVEILLAVVKNIEKSENFKITTTQGEFFSHSVIVASGINDILPEIENLFEYLGETFFTCLDCDGHELTDKKVSIIGNGDGTARTALAVKQLYTDKITIVTEGQNEFSTAYQKKLESEKISIVENKIKRIEGKNNQVEKIIFSDGMQQDCERILSDLGYTRNDAFLEKLSLKRSPTGYIAVNENYKSSMPGLYVIGPLNTGPDQVSIAVGEGARAAIDIIESQLDLKAI